MSRRVISICLALIMSSISFGDWGLLGTFEGNMWGPSGDWTVQGGSAYSFSNTIGVTDADCSLVITPPAPGWQWVLYNGNMYGSRDKLRYNRMFADVTWIASEWDGTGIWAQWSKIALNSAPGWWETPVIDTANPAYPGSWDPYNWGEVHTRTLEWDISSYNWVGVEGSWWLQLSMSINFGGDAGFTWGNFYIDNIRVLPEPSTIALLALGGLALIRRKR